MGDLHCGHAIGLTPKNWQYHPKLKKQQAKLWSFYKKIAEETHYDVLIVNGDAVDGTGGRSGGVELIAPDMADQAQMAVDCIKLVNADKIVMTYGTPYHVASSDGTDWEAEIASAVGAEIHSHLLAKISGVQFSIKHKPAGGSQIPHGRHTGVARDRLWDTFWADYEDREKCDVFIRSHVHYFNYCGGPEWLAMTMPALQGAGSKFGARQCSGIVDFGAVTFDISRGDYSWRPHLLKVQQKRKVLEL